MRSNANDDFDFRQRARARYPIDEVKAELFNAQAKIAELENLIKRLVADKNAEIERVDAVWRMRFQAMGALKCGLGDQS
jgi:hypothetical protein